MQIVNFIISIFGFLAIIMIIASFIFTPIFLIVWLASQTEQNKAKYKKITLIFAALIPIAIVAIIFNLMAFAYINTLMSTELGGDDLSPVMEIEEEGTSSLIR